MSSIFVFLTQREQWASNWSAVFFMLPIFMTCSLIYSVPHQVRRKCFGDVNNKAREWRPQILPKCGTMKKEIILKVRKSDGRYPVCLSIERLNVQLHYLSIEGAISVLMLWLLPCAYIGSEGISQPPNFSLMTFKDSWNYNQLFWEPVGQPGWDMWNSVFLEDRNEVRWKIQDYLAHCI